MSGGLSIVSRLMPPDQSRDHRQGDALPQRKSRKPGSAPLPQPSHDRSSQESGHETERHEDEHDPEPARAPEVRDVVRLHRVIRDGGGDGDAVDGAQHADQHRGRPVHARALMA
jgi:hypothetical protein